VKLTLSLPTGFCEISFPHDKEVWQHPQGKGQLSVQCHLCSHHLHFLISAHPCLSCLLIVRLLAFDCNLAKGGSSVSFAQCCTLCLECSVVVHADLLTDCMFEWRNSCKGITCGSLFWYHPGVIITNHSQTFPSFHLCIPEFVFTLIRWERVLLSTEMFCHPSSKG
jgi:hypothetical protein